VLIGSDAQMQVAQPNHRSHPRRVEQAPEGSLGSYHLMRHCTRRPSVSRSQHHRCLRDHHHCPHVRFCCLHAHCRYPSLPGEQGFYDVWEVDVGIFWLGAAVEPPSVMVPSYARRMHNSMLGSDLLQLTSALESFGTPNALL
jgi:hypothetical protein